MTSFGHRPISRRAAIQVMLGGVATSLLAACSPGARRPGQARRVEASRRRPAGPAGAGRAHRHPARRGGDQAGRERLGQAHRGAAKPTAEAKPAADAKRGRPAQVRAAGSVVGQVGDNSAFEPFVQQPTTFPYLENLFGTPIRYDNQIKPNAHLAESWQLAQDGKSLTIKLRPGVKFSNGKEVSADDLNFSVERAKDPKVGALFRPQAALVTKTETTDKSTAVWRFESAFPGAFDLLARQWVVDKDTIGLDDWKKKLIGTGPFTWEEWQPGERSLLKRRADYWEKDRPYLDEIEVRSFGDANSMAANLEPGPSTLSLACP